MSGTIRLYNPSDVGSNLKMAILSGYTFSSSHSEWSDVLSYEISATGEYPSGGVALTSTYEDYELSITDFSLYLVTAPSVSHLVVYDTDTSELILAVEYDPAENWNNTAVEFDWPDSILIYDFSPVEEGLYVLRFYSPVSSVANLKMAILAGYTFNVSHERWSQVSSYEIDPTGEYPAGGVNLSFTYTDRQLSISNFDLDIVSASNVTHRVVYNNSSKKLLFVAQYDSARNWDVDTVPFNWPVIVYETASSGRKRKSMLIEIEHGAIGGGTGQPAEVYDLRDEFMAPRTAGNVHGSLAEPGPGTRSLVDTASIVSVANGKLTCSTSTTGIDDPKFSIGSVSWGQGKIFLARVSALNIGSNVSYLHFLLRSGGYLTNHCGALYCTYNDICTTNNIGWYNWKLASFSSGNYYVFGLVTGNNRTFIFVDGQLRHILSLGSSTITPMVTSVTNGRYPPSVEFLRHPQTRWCPQPLVADAFGGTWPTTDGGGFTDLEAGGSGLSWSTKAGTIGISSGKAVASALSGGRAIATVDLSTVNVLAMVNLVKGTSGAGIVVRYADSNNYIYAYHNGTNALLIKRVGGVETTVINTAATYSSGAPLMIVSNGTEFRLYYNNANVGNPVTISDSGLQSGTGTGMIFLDTDSTLDNYGGYARGNEGQYDILNRWSW